MGVKLAAYVSSAGTVLVGTNGAIQNTTEIELTINTICAIIGASVAVLTFLANLYYNHQKLQLAKEDRERESCIESQQDKEPS